MVSVMLRSSRSSDALDERFGQRLHLPVRRRASSTSAVVLLACAQ
jgi:hypothetical protein